MIVEGKAAKQAGEVGIAAGFADFGWATEPEGV
ncbi:MAG: hypothetical protein RL215_51 [Planctomycetota bacterium]|jgi:hypothetical protein